MTNLLENQPTTFKDILAFLKKTNAYLRETSRLQKKNERILTEKFTETRRMIKENEAKADRQREKDAAEAKQRFQEAELRFQKFEKIKDEIWTQIRETEKIVEENSKHIGGMGNSNGKVAETYFVNSFKKHLHFAGQEFDSIASDFRKKVKKLNLEDQYDIVLYNGTSVVVIEVKYTAEKKNIEQTLKKAQTFKQLFPEYARYNLYLGLAGLHFDKDVEAEAITQGIAVIKQVGDAVVINDKHLKVF